MKTILEAIEKVLLAILLIGCLLGMFFTGCLGLYCLYGGDALNLRSELAILLVSIVLVYTDYHLLLAVHYKRLNMLVDESETDDDELYEHLIKNITYL